VNATEISITTSKYYVEKEIDSLLYLDRESLKLLKNIFEIKIKHKIVTKLANLIWNEILETRSLYTDSDTFEFDIKKFIEYQVFSKEWKDW